MKGIQIALHAPLSDKPLGRGNCDRLPVSNATSGFPVIFPFQKISIVAWFGVIVLLLLAIACSAPVSVPTSTPLPTYTPYPTATPQPTYTPYPTPTPAPTATPTPEPTATPTANPTPTPTPIPTATPTLTPEPTVTPTPTSVPTITPTPKPSTGEWEQFETTDPISDMHDTVIALRASESTLEFPYEDPLIWVVCQTPSRGDPLLGVIISWEEYLGSDDTIVDWRVNDEPVSTREWVLVGDDTTLSFDTDRIVSDLLRADTITARVHRSFSNSLTAVWNVEGFAEAYKPVEEACKQ